MVNAILTGVSIWLTYRLASKLVSKPLSMLAAVLTLLSPMFLLLSGSLLSHTFSLFLTLAFVLAWLDMFGDVQSDISDKGIPTWLLNLFAVLALVMLLIVGNVVFYILARMAMMSQLFDISRSRPESFEALGVERGLVIVHTIESWRDYGTLLMLTPPFADSDLILVISRVSGENESLIQSNSDRPIYHYYPDEPSILYDSLR